MSWNFNKQNIIFSHISSKWKIKVKEKEKVRCVFAVRIQLTDENHQLNQFSAFIWKRIGWITNLTVYKWACKEVKNKFGKNTFYSWVWVCESEEQCWFEMKLHLPKYKDVTGWHLAGNFDISSSLALQYLAFDSLAWALPCLELAGVGSRLDLPPRNLAVETSLWNDERVDDFKTALSSSRIFCPCDFMTWISWQFTHCLVWDRRFLSKVTGSAVASLLGAILLTFENLFLSRVQCYFEFAQFPTAAI